MQLRKTTQAVLACVLVVLCVASSVHAHEEEGEGREDPDLTPALMALTTSGQVTSTACGTKSSGQCLLNGSYNYVTRSLTYSNTTGIFTGTMTTNLCPGTTYGTFNKVGGTALAKPPANAQCFQQTFPAPAYASGLPAAAPLRGIVAYSFDYGVSVYGPFDAGFSLGFACDNSKGECDSGTDVDLCESKLKQDCGDSHFKYQVMLDDCGGHADAYHYHADLACDYNTTATGHSALVAIALDGRGVYGLHESTGTAPTDLDACGGHYGPVPEHTVGGVTYPAATNVYHYHTQAKAPFTLGCYGPTTSLSQCKGLYSTCNTGYGTYYTEDGCYYNYDLDCPCFKQGTETYNQVNTSITQANCVAPSTSSGITIVPQLSLMVALGAIVVAFLHGSK